MRGRERRNARFIEKGYEVEDEKKIRRERGASRQEQALLWSIKDEKALEWPTEEKTKGFASYPSVQHLSCPSVLYLKGKRP